MQDPLKQGLKHLEKGSVDAYRPHLNARSTKTRIETEFGQVLTDRRIANLNARSTKTRIETLLRKLPGDEGMNLNARSTKTRIETYP